MSDATTALAAAQAAAASSQTASNAADFVAEKAAEVNTAKVDAASSATTATTKASEASTSASQALTSKNAAATSATNAATSETNAATSASTATTKAGEASTSAATATTKAGEASSSATNAANSAASVPGMWQPSTVYTAGSVKVAPDGTTISRNANGTSRASFDSTEEAAWTSVLAKSGTLAQRDLSATIDARVPAASDTAAGKVELATTAETNTGTDTARAVTPAGLAAVASTIFELRKFYILGGSTSWQNAINSAIAAANTNGGGVIRFPENTTINMGAVATALGSNITLQIPRSCTIVKTNGTFNNIFALATPTYPAYTENVHIIGGTWKWTTATDPGGDDGRGPILFRYGNNVSVQDAIFECLSTSHPTRRTSGPYFQWCNRVRMLNCKVTDAVNGVTVSAQSAPDDAGRACSNITIRDNEMVRTATPTSTNTPGVFVKGDYANSRTVSNVKVRDNLITNHGMGIEVGPGDNARVSDNTISGYLLGISMADMTNSRVRRNDLSGSVTGRLIGIEVTGGASSRVTDNSVIEGAGTSAPCIGVYGSSTTRNSNKTVVAGNYCEGGADGIQILDNASYCRVRGNTLRTNATGVKVGPFNAVTTANTVYNVIDTNVIDRPTVYGVNVVTYSTFSTTNIVIANNVLIGATATINGTVSGVSSQNVTAT